MSGSVWLPVPGYEGVYEVSDLGEIRRILPSQGTRCGPVKTHLGKRGYMIVNLCKDGKRCVRYVHQLVCEAFNGPAPAPNMEPNHEDSDRTNNAHWNLTWVTRSQNNFHMWRAVKRRAMEAANAP